MLSRAIIVTGLTFASMTVASPAYAGHHPKPIQINSNSDGVIGTTIVVPGRGTPPRHAPQPGTSPGSPAPSCPWVRVHIFQGRTLPTSVNGKKGTWWDEYCNGSNPGFAGTPVFVPNGTPPRSVLTISPAILAQRAVNQLRLPTPRVGRDPRGQALVNLAEWFWIAPAQWRVLTQRTAAGPEWAVVTARPVSTSWDPGDGSTPVVCAGPGTPYDPSVSASVQSTDCSYTYARSSAGQPRTGPNPNDRYFTVTVTTTWQVSWVGAGGTSGTLPAIARSTSFPLAVAQRETVVTGGTG
jgi:hypothetical protein